MHNLRGVTLIELLVAIVILGLIVTSVYTAFNCSRDSWQVGETMVQRYQNARGILDIMSREIRTAMVNAAGTLYCMGRADAFYFTGLLRNSIELTDDLYRVGYWWESSSDEGEDPGVIVRGFECRESTEPYYTFDDLSNQPVGLHAVSLAFRYYSNDNDWLDAGQNWIEGIFTAYGSLYSNDLPDAIEISVTVRDDYAIESQTFRTVVNMETAD